MTSCVDQDWYLSFLIWVPALVMLGGLIFTLWTGKIYARGPIYLRDKNPSQYWTGIGILVILLIVTISLASEALPCEGWPHV